METRRDAELAVDTTPPHVAWGPASRSRWTSAPGLIGFARCTLVVGAVAVFFTNLDAYGYVLWFTPAPIRWVLAFATGAVALVLVSPHRSLATLGSPVTAWIGLFFLVTTAWAIWTPGLPDVVQELRDRYRSILLLFTLTLLLDDPRAHRAGVLGVGIAVAFAAILNVAELRSLVVFPAVEGRVAGRAAGFYINANAAGFAISLGSALVVPKLPRTWRIPFLFLAALGVVATFSRGATASFAVVIAALTWKGLLGRRLYVAALLLSALFSLTHVADYLDRNGLLNENTAARVRLQHGDSQRRDLAGKAWDVFAERPLLGAGLASTVTWGSPDEAHNMFLTFAADHGLLGLLLFPALAAALVARRRAVTPYVLALMTAGITNHNLLVARYALFLTALAATWPDERAADANRAA